MLLTEQNWLLEITNATWETDPLSAVCGGLMETLPFGEIVFYLILLPSVIMAWSESDGTLWPRNKKIWSHSFLCGLIKLSSWQQMLNWMVVVSCDFIWTNQMKSHQVKTLHIKLAWTLNRIGRGGGTLWSNESQCEWNLRMRVHHVIEPHTHFSQVIF